MALARIPRRWGYDRDGRGLLLTRRVRYRRPDKPVHMVRYYLDLMEGLGMATETPEIRLQATPEETGRGRGLLAAAGIDSGRPLVVLNPGAAYGPAKRWPAERFAELAALLQNRHGAEIAVTGAADDREAAAVIGAGLSRPAADLTGRTTLRDLLGVIARGRRLRHQRHRPDAHGQRPARPGRGASSARPSRGATAPFHPPSDRPEEGRRPAGPASIARCPYDHRCMTGDRGRRSVPAGGRGMTSP